MKKVPQLTLPKEDHSVAKAVHLSRTGPDSFGKRVMDIINEHDKMPLPISRESSDKAMAERACERINQRHTETRKAIDLAMMSYLLDNDGKVDLWPDSVSLNQAYWKTIANDDVRFDYFGDEYVVKRDGDKHVVKRRSGDFIYRNCFEAWDIPEYYAVKRKREEALREVEHTRGNANYALVVLCSLGIVYLVYAFLTILGDMFFGIWESFFKPLYYSWGLDVSGEGIGFVLKQVGYTLLSAPAGLHGMIKDSFEGPSGIKVYWIIVVLALLFTAGGALVCWIKLSESIGRNHDYSRAKQAYRKIADGEELKRVKAENEQWKRDCEALSEQWHRAWFEWIKSHKEHGGQASVEASKASVSKQLKDNLRELEYQNVVKEMGIDLPAGVTATQWLTRYSQLLDEGLEKIGKSDPNDMTSEEMDTLMTGVIGQLTKEGLL